MTELSFLIELLLNHKLSKEVKVLIANRVKEIESIKAQPAPVRITNGTDQAPSTLKNLAMIPDNQTVTAPLASKRIAGVEVDYGGSRGPRKF